MYQGFKSIEDYHKDMEVSLTSANVLESNEATMAPTGGVKRRRQKRLKKGKSPKKGSSIPQGRKEERTLASPVLMSKNSNIKCFKGNIALNCPNKRSMILKEDGIVDSQLCLIIIDDGSSVNVVSSRLVEKLKLPTLAHPKP
ncbi:hypothetical protein CR513_19044, partial [Mucuna pruriens]